MSLQVNDIVDGKYRIIRLLGEGGMGAVYEGDNTRIHRRVAIKVLHAGVAQSKDAVERFEREAQAAGRIGSEHIVEVLDLGTLPKGERYMVMEYLEGESLSQRIESRGRLDPHTTAELAVQLLEGLKAAHDAGIIHRDLKPENVFILTAKRGRRDFVKIVDFGISKFSALSGDFSMTRTGTVMGTPYYMSPEQAKGARAVDQRADLYAVGVILYEASTGKVPFDADTFNELLFKIVLENPVAVHEKVPEIDERFSAIVQKAMAKSPTDRYQSAEEFQKELSAYVEQMPIEHGATVRAGTPARAIAATQVAPAPVALVEEPTKKGQTLGTWAHTHDGALAPTEIPPKNQLNKAALGVGAGLLVAAAVGFFALRAAPPTSAQVPVQTAPAAPPAVSAPKVEASLAAPTADAPKASEPEKAEPAQAGPAQTGPAQTEPAEAGASKAPSVAAKASPQTHAATAAKASTTAKPNAPAKPAASDKAGAGSTPAATGRRIRTTL